jgi:hypothetical protein
MTPNSKSTTYAYRPPSYVAARSPFPRTPSSCGARPRRRVSWSCWPPCIRCAQPTSSPCSIRSVKNQFPRRAASCWEEEKEGVAEGGGDEHTTHQSGIAGSVPPSPPRPHTARTRRSRRGSPVRAAGCAPACTAARSTARDAAVVGAEGRSPSRRRRRRSCGRRGAQAMVLMKPPPMGGWVWYG